MVARIFIFIPANIYLCDVAIRSKIKRCSKIEQLESHLANKILEQEAIKKELEKLRIDKEKETQTIQQKHEQDMKAMREEMNRSLIHIMSLIHQNPKLAQIKPKVLTDKFL
jgi:hypothetical protein